ncbi:MAG: alpha/beta hydrolase [Lachnospiraceae bacterium]|nr:alpha/beta hydrolase [Lachnospiraceae bacterium]MDY3223529.1 alpha/beta hydrolase [Lachnospiraceae bacterium]
MSKVKRKGRIMWGFIYVITFIVVFVASAIFKMTYDPSHGAYKVDWNESVGTVHTDLPYGDGEANKFDLYLPADSSKGSYGLVVYLHAGGFTSGDKKDDTQMLQWLCSKGYVAAGINYTLRTEENTASVYSQSVEIRDAIPVVIEKAKKLGYSIDKMAVAGGSAGHALAMIYAYRDAEQSPVPVVLTFGAVGPASYYQEDWGGFGLDKSDEACAAMFSVMSGEKITPEEVADGSYLQKVKPISPADWVTADSPATVVAYGTHDKIQPFLASLRLKSALQENGVDYKYFEAEHSGHGLQNDSKVSIAWMKAIEAYLDKYMGS